MQFTLPHVTFTFVKIPSLTPAILNLLMAATLTGAVATSLNSPKLSKIKVQAESVAPDEEFSPFILEEILSLYSPKIKSCSISGIVIAKPYKGPGNSSEFSYKAKKISFADHMTCSGLPRPNTLTVEYLFSALNYENERVLGFISGENGQISPSFHPPVSPQAPFKGDPEGGALAPGEPQAHNFSPTIEESEAAVVEQDLQACWKILTAAKKASENMEQTIAEVPLASPPPQIQIDCPKIESRPQQWICPHTDFPDRFAYTDPVLRHWLMLLEPSPHVLTKNDQIPLPLWLELPLRRALGKTLVSPEFKDYINLSWETDDDNEMKERHEAFFQAYVEAVDWAKLGYELYNHPQVGTHSDLTFTEEVKEVAMKVPFRLGILKAGDEDFGHD